MTDGVLGVVVAAVEGVGLEVSIGVVLGGVEGGLVVVAVLGVEGGPLEGVVEGRVGGTVVEVLIDEVEELVLDATWKKNITMVSRRVNLSK